MNDFDPFSATRRGRGGKKRSGGRPRPERPKEKKPQQPSDLTTKPGQPTGGRKHAVNGFIAVEMIATTKITPNDYNPNELTEEEFKEYLAEAKRLGRLPKPIFVRPNRDGGYESVDGEHGWKVAKELGWAEVPCEVEDLDDFEAMRRTYKRNRHGSFNQVRLGRMFKKMMKKPKLSNRALARKIRVSETTVRNALRYADAAKMRNDFAPNMGDRQIARLTVKQVQQYHKLPKGERDAWLDAGADMSAVKPAVKRRKPAGEQPTDNTPAPSTDTEPVESETTAAAQGKAPQAGAINPVGPNPACPESPAPEAPTAQSGGVAPERTDAVGPAPPEPKLDREATSSIGSNSACPEPPAQDGPPTQTEGKATERTDAAGPAPPEPNFDNEALDALIAAWKQAGRSERRVFLSLLPEDAESMAIIKAVLFPQYQG
jgi:ParB/RepB/Spo0J family partition protein